MQPEKEKTSTTTARDNMMRLYEWMTVWDKYVKQEKREHENNDTGRKTRKRL